MSPRIGFVVGGVQKGGTTALANFIGQHPQVRLPADKEAHVFDAPGFDEAWDAAAVDRRYLPHFGGALDRGALHGDATPIYCFYPRVIERIARYNPAMRWILILRHPVDRAVSQYRMEHARGYDAWPLWAAALLERWRVAGRWDDFDCDSPVRHVTYLSRGDYARQLDALYRHFPRDQVLLLRNGELAGAPDEVMVRVWRFLGLAPPPVQPTYGRVFDGGYAPLPQSAPTRRLLGLLLRRPMREAARRHGIHW
ncbi:sulfotransferase family protein [Pseudoxanthomonas broegbernensis]|nr:sulfotransferase [Pseudoxanthomonas broegbernensis]MBB6063634.1 hypothetical protein [Pseudoxanthomonas broegbernensis]